MKFPYKSYQRFVLRPVIPIRLKHGRAGLLYEALVDSGADVSLFGREIGEALGIEIESGAPYKVLGVGGGHATYYMHAVTVIVAGLTYKTEIGFLETPNEEIAPYGVLGQKGLFDKFIVSFDLFEKEIMLKERK